METLLTTILSLSRTDENAGNILFNLTLAFAIGLVIAFVYQKTHMGLSYSRPFLTTLVIMAVLGAVVMMVVSQNFIGAFALLGAFALIRFRTILKETRDIAFVFFALVEGVAVGMSNYVIAFISTGFISAVILFLERINFGRTVRGGYLLTIIATDPFSPTDWASWREYVKRSSILHVKTLDNQETEYMIDISLEDSNNAHSLISLLRKAEGVLHAELVSGDDAAEY
jgi:uncharacterized membrane protein YhiD involved in acid resistance